MSSAEINTSLNNVYTKSNYYNKYTADIFITGGLFLLFIFIYMNLTSKNRNKYIQLNWNSLQCNPQYLYFSGWLKENEKNPSKSTRDQFEKCIKESTKKRNKNKYNKAKNTSQCQLDTAKSYHTSFRGIILRQYAIFLKYLHLLTNLIFIEAGIYD